MLERKRAQAVEKEIAILVRVILPDDDFDTNRLDADPLDELEGLSLIHI